MTERPRVLALVGATATGKTAVAERIAQRLGAEIVCADSRQVFRELNIGTGKPTGAQLARGPHHLFAALSVGERPSAGWFGRAAGATCTELHSAGRIPLLVGGSGLYLRALMSGLAAEPPHDPAVRARLAGEAERLGTAALHARLSALDPPAAERLNPLDTQRVTRALEVLEASGRPQSWWHAQPGHPGLDARWHIVELVVPPQRLGALIDERTRSMFDSGLVEEAAALKQAGKEGALRSLRAVGYDEALELLAGTLDRAAAVERASRRTRQLAKRQRTWFRHQVQADRLESGRWPDERLDEAILASFDGTGPNG